MAVCGLTRQRQRRSSGAFVFFLVLLFVDTPLQADCDPAFDAGFYADVSKVLDGDTLEIVDGRRVRLIGLNAPELKDSDGNSQPFAKKAGEALQQLIRDSGNRVYLVPDREVKDRHGRLLAHVLGAGGQNLSHAMIRLGLAVRSTVFPNDKFADCYQVAEDQARTERLGLWRNPGFWLIERRPLDKQRRGFYIISDRVKSVAESRKSIWINLQHGVALRIARLDLANFPNRDWHNLEEKLVEARGWLIYSRDHHQLRVREPLSLKEF